jgi:hypothetical protein
MSQIFPFSSLLSISLYRHFISKSKASDISMGRLAMTLEYPTVMVQPLYPKMDGGSH